MARLEDIECLQPTALQMGMKHGGSEQVHDEFAQATAPSDVKCAMSLN